MCFQCENDESPLVTRRSGMFLNSAYEARFSSRNSPRTFRAPSKPSLADTAHTLRMKSPSVFISDALACKILDFGLDVTIISLFRWIPKPIPGFWYQLNSGSIICQFVIKPQEIESGARFFDYMHRSRFIVFEGIDGSGKSTQARRLADYLTSQSIPVALTAEPSDSPAGLKIKSLKFRLDPEAEAQLFIQDRRHHVENVILPSLSSGCCVICDRYVYSSAAYQGSRGLSPDEILRQNFEFAPVPDVVFLIEIPVELAIERIGKNRAGNFSAFEKLESLRQVDQVYRSLDRKEIIRIDGTQNEECVSQMILNVVKLYFT